MAMIPQIGPAWKSVGLTAGLTRSTTPLVYVQRASRFSSFSSTASFRSQSSKRTAHRVLGQRPFSQQSHRPKANSKVHDSKIRWHPIPVGLGVGFLGLVQFYKVYTREQDEDELDKKPKKRPRVRPDGPWYVAPFESQ